MNLFKSVIKWTGVGVYACFLATSAYAATMPGPIKLYVIYTYKFNERVIEKIFIKKENAQSIVRHIKTITIIHLKKLL